MLESIIHRGRFIESTAKHTKSRCGIKHAILIRNQCGKTHGSHKQSFNNNVHRDIETKLPIKHVHTLTHTRPQ